jgi:hypothetical protein
MPTNNPINLKPALNEQTNILTSELIKNKDVALQNQADIAFSLAALLAKIELENNQNEAILNSITTVNGSLDENVTAINQHTTSAKNDLGGLINAAKDSIKAHTDATKLNIDTSIINSRDSLYQAINDAITESKNNVNSNIFSSRDNVNTNVYLVRDQVKAEIVRTDGGSLYGFLSGDITATRNAVIENINAAKDAVIENVNAAKDALFTSLNIKISEAAAFLQGVVASARDNTNSTVVQARDYLVNIINSSRDNNNTNIYIARDQINAATEAVKHFLNGSIYDIENTLFSRTRLNVIKKKTPMENNGDATIFATSTVPQGHDITAFSYNGSGKIFAILTRRCIGMRVIADGIEVLRTNREDGSSSFANIVNAGNSSNLQSLEFSESLVIQTSYSSGSVTLNVKGVLLT